MPLLQSTSDHHEPARFGDCMLGRVTCCQKVDDAIDTIRHALDIPMSDVAAAMMPDQRTWSRMQHREQLMAIASWIAAECHAEADRGDVTRPLQAPKDVVATND